MQPSPKENKLSDKWAPLSGLVKSSLKRASCTAELQCFNNKALHDVALKKLFL